MNNATLCYAILSESDMDKFAFAIRNNYWYQMYIGTSPRRRAAPLAGGGG